METTGEKLARRDAFAAHQARQLSPDELLVKLWARQRASLKKLKQTPELWDRFVRYQMKKRAIDERPEHFR